MPQFDPRIEQALSQVQQEQGSRGKNFGLDALAIMGSVFGESDLPLKFREQQLDRTQLNQETAMANLQGLLASIKGQADVKQTEARTGLLEQQTKRSQTTQELEKAKIEETHARTIGLIQSQALDNAITGANIRRQIADRTREVRLATMDVESKDIELRSDKLKLDTAQQLDKVAQEAIKEGRPDLAIAIWTGNTGFMPRESGEDIVDQVLDNPRLKALALQVSEGMDDEGIRNAAGDIINAIAPKEVGLPETSPHRKVIDVEFAFQRFAYRPHEELSKGVNRIPNVTKSKAFLKALVARTGIEYFKALQETGEYDLLLQEYIQYFPNLRSFDFEKILLGHKRTPAELKEISKREKKLMQPAELFLQYGKL